MQTRQTKKVTQYTFKIGNHDGNVIMVFPQPVRDISFVPEQARAVAKLLLEHAQLADRTIILPPGVNREAPAPPAAADPAPQKSAGNGPDKP